MTDRIPAVNDSVAFFRHNLQVAGLPGTITRVWPADVEARAEVSVEVIVEDGSTHTVAVLPWGDASTSVPHVRWLAP